jgi:hypothetical protein
MSRHYKETVRPAGVFAIRNLESGRVLVLASLDLASMMNRQRFQLDQGKHSNRALQQDWNALGPGAFRFEELARLKERDNPAFDRAAELEALFVLWCEECDCHGERGYNGPAKRKP